MTPTQKARKKVYQTAKDFIKQGLSYRDTAMELNSLGIKVPKAKKALGNDTWSEKRLYAFMRAYEIFLDAKKEAVTIEKTIAAPPQTKAKKLKITWTIRDILEMGFSTDTTVKMLEEARP